MKQYSFLNTLLLVNGVEITGWAEGDDNIALTRREDSASDVVGSAGEMVVSINANRSGTVVFKLLQTSNSNTYLSLLVAAMENDAFVPVFVQFKDTVGGDLASGSQGYISKPADIVRGGAPNAQEWTIVVERLDMLHGGA